MTKMTSAGARGKAAEAAVKDWLADRAAADACFDYERVPDARTAGGRFPSRPGDFEWWSPKRHGLIEVKEIAHDYLLPSKAFKNSKGVLKFGRLKKRWLAGGEITILVNSTTTGWWYLVLLEQLMLNMDAPSWDLRRFATNSSKNLEDLLWPLNPQKS